MIGAVLVAARAITQEQLDRAVERQRESGGAVGDALVATGAISETALAEALAREARVEYTDLADADPDTEAAARIPEVTARSAWLVPVAPRGAPRVGSGGADPAGIPAGKRVGNRVRLAQADPFDVVVADEIQHLVGAPVDIVCAPKSAIVRLLDAAYGSASGSRLRPLVDEAAASLGGPFDDDGPTEASPVVRLADALLHDAVTAGATDLHLEPDESLVHVRRRVDGVLRHVETLPRELLAPVVSRLKVMAGLDIAESRCPQDGRISITLAGRPIDFRVATQPTLHGENIVLRVLDREKGIVPLNALGLTDGQRAILDRILARPEGLTLVVGPTGSGKTTTLYSILNHLNAEAVNIMTLEDPVEYPLAQLRQTSVGEASRLDFADGVRALLRQDPDILLIGEIRDTDTARMALRAALTGHRVFSTLHANSVAGALQRLVDIGLRTDMLAGSLGGIIAQRLVRRLCPDCRTETTAGQDDCRLLGLDPASLHRIFHPVGCPACDFRGYRGRLAIMELVRIDPALDELIHEGASLGRVRTALRARGHVSLADDGIRRVLDGSTSIAELTRVVDLAAHADERGASA